MVYVLLLFQAFEYEGNALCKRKVSKAPKRDRALASNEETHDQGWFSYL